MRPALVYYESGRPLIRFRIPKPSNGWATFGWEIAIVAVGVALAIGAERLVQRYNWNQDAKQASAAIKAELTEHQVDAVERLAVQPCLKQQLDKLYNTLSIHRGGHWAGMPMIVRQQGQFGAQQRVIVAAYRAPERYWRSEAWQTARSSGALNHLPQMEVSQYAQAYHGGEQMLELQDAESTAAAKLSALAVDGVVDAQGRIQLLAALAETDRANAYLEIAATQEVELLRRLLADLPQQARHREVAERIAIQRRFRGSCVLPLKLNRN